MSERRKCDAWKCNACGRISADRYTVCPTCDSEEWFQVQRADEHPKAASGEDERNENKLNAEDFAAQFVSSMSYLDEMETHHKKNGAYFGFLAGRRGMVPASEVEKWKALYFEQRDRAIISADKYANLSGDDK